MTFEDLFAFWLMKNMVHHDACMTREKMLNSDDRNVVYMAQIRDIPNNGEKHAQIIYRYTINNGVKHDFKLVYADILYTGFAGAPGTDQIFVKNATVENLVTEFTGKFPWGSCL